MRIRLLGTAAAEGVPALYCHCPTCESARAKKGRNIRRRSAILIDDCMCIDYGPDIAAAFESVNYDAANLRHLLITHSHFDHFYPENLEIRGRRYLTETPSMLEIVGNSATFLRLSMLGYRDEELQIKRREPKIGAWQKVGQYEIMPIPANHAHDLGGALNYVVRRNDKSILYATDTGVYTADAFEIINGIRFNLIILDATNYYCKSSRNHLTKEGILQMISFFRANGNMDQQTRIILTHFSHTGSKDQESMEEDMRKLDLVPGYDGMEVWI